MWVQQHPTHIIRSSSTRHNHLSHFHHRSASQRIIHTTTRCSSSSQNGEQEEGPLSTSPPPAEQFAPLASTFQRRLFTGVGSASLVALGANFGGITSFLLGLSPETGRNLKLDVLYPIGDYFRYIQPDQGFEFIYPANWVGDQTLLYRAARQAERERASALDPFPPLRNGSSTNINRIKSSSNEPVVAFGPPGSSGELNVSVVMSQVPLDFRIEAFGGPEEVGKMIIQSVTHRRSGTDDVTGTLMRATRKEDDDSKVSYYELEFRVQSPKFQRHNIAVCCVKGSQLYTLNAQAPELVWPQVKDDLYMIANSFKLTGDGGGG